MNKQLFSAAALLVALLSQGSVSTAQVNGKIDDVDFKLKFNGRVNMDLGTFLGADDDKANRNGVSINDCRLGVIADFDTVWQAKLEVSYSGKAIAFRDVYIKRTFKSAGSEVQLGNFFFPFGYKRAGLGYKFVDTAPSDAAFTPLRKLGAAYQSFSDSFNWGLGFFSDGNVDDGKKTNQGYSFDAYALLRPILTSSEVLHFTASGILTHPADKVKFTASMPLMFTSFPLVKTDDIEAYNYGRLEVAALGIVRRFYAEARFLKAWVNTPNEVYSTTKDADGNDVTVATPQDNYDGAYGFYVQATWRVTGENQGYNKKTGLASHPRGRAFEVLARFDRTDLDQFGSVNNVTLGVNYHFNKYLRARLNYVHAAIKDGADVDALCSRVQFSF
ncbi:MAG: porin [Marinilabiliaceae bacterium]